MLEIIIGNMDKGNRRILNKDSATKALSASNIFSVLLSTYVANVTSETKKGAHAHTKDVPAARYPICRNILISLSRMAFTASWKLGSQAYNLSIYKNVLTFVKRIQVSNMVVLLKSA